MGACLSKCLTILTGVSIILICSCEKHRVGEMPEVQKENVELARNAEKGAPSGEESKASSGRASATPAEFFPEKKSP
jgi:hypothetical protein